LALGFCLAWIGSPSILNFDGAVCCGTGGIMAGRIQHKRQGEIVYQDIGMRTQGVNIYEGNAEGARLMVVNPVSAKALCLMWLCKN